MNRRDLALTAIVIIVVAFFWLVLNTNTLKKSHKAPGPNDSSAFVVDADILKTDLDGKPAVRLYSPKLLYYPVDKSTSIDTPHFVIYTNSSKPWVIDALHGKAHNGVARIVLWGNVILSHPGDEDTTKTKLRTDSITIYPNKRFAETKEPVVLEQPGSVVWATGLTADLKKGTVKLLSKAKGAYESVQK